MKNVDFGFDYAHALKVREVQEEDHARAAVSQLNEGRRKGGLALDS